MKITEILNSSTTKNIQTRKYQCLDVCNYFYAKIVSQFITMKTKL